MKWITREKIKVDRVACPWLIKQFVDPEAEFVFLPHATDWSKIDNGIVFDIPNCELGHHGEDVSFNSIVRKYKLTDPALALLGEIVRRVSGKPLDQFAREQIFEPLGMKETTFNPPASLATRIAPTEIEASTGQPWLGVAATRISATARSEAAADRFTFPSTPQRAEASVTSAYHLAHAHCTQP